MNPIIASYIDKYFLAKADPFLLKHREDLTHDLLIQHYRDNGLTVLAQELEGQDLTKLIEYKKKVLN